MCQNVRLSPPRSGAGSGHGGAAEALPTLSLLLSPGRRWSGGGGVRFALGHRSYWQVLGWCFWLLGASSSTCSPLTSPAPLHRGAGPCPTPAQRSCNGGAGSGERGWTRATETVGGAAAAPSLAHPLLPVLSRRLCSIRVCRCSLFGGAVRSSTRDVPVVSGGMWWVVGFSRLGSLGRLSCCQERVGAAGSDPVSPWQ